MNKPLIDKTVQVEEISWPEFGVGERPAMVSLEELQSRLQMIRTAMKSKGFSHMVIYGDREHFANLTWATNIDPRFEEALLILRGHGAPLMLVGNECQGYLPFSPLYNAGEMRGETYQSFSLLSQPRDNSRRLKDIFIDEGMTEQSKVGSVGWKYFIEGEEDDHQHTIDLPSFITDAARAIVGFTNVINANDLFMDPAYGFRTSASASEIAYFEYSNAKSSEGVRKMLFGLKEDMTDHQFSALSQWDGEPLGCHPTLASGDLPGLSSPQGRTLKLGEVLSFNLCYWGSNICRAGWVARSSDDLPREAQDYIKAFAGPYFKAMAQWFSALKIGAKGGLFHDIIHDQLPFDQFGIFLNAGHLIHLDEWVSSPIYKGSDLPIRSGMVFQVDVIPSSSLYGSTRMEDGIFIADDKLQNQLKEKYPDCYARCLARREFMRNTLGFEVSDDVLPMSNIPAIVPPWFLAPNKVLVLR